MASFDVKRKTRLRTAYMDRKAEAANISVFNNGHAVLQSIGLYADLYFIDEQMPYMSGMELTCLIREVNNFAAIIFVSHIHGAVFHSFRYYPLRFIRKDCLREELPEALDAFCERYYSIEQNIALSSLTTITKQQILLRDILYIESKAHYIIINCTGKSYQIRGKLSDYEQMLSSHLFSRASQSFLVNLRGSFPNNG